MALDDFDSANYITLKQFEGGWIWIKNISDASARVLPYLANISVNQIQEIADLLNGKVLEWQLFNDTQWILQLIPLPDFIILYVFNQDEEFGADLKIFYHKSSLKVPTEDAYVFTEYLLDLIGILAKDGIEKAASTQFQDELINLEDLMEKVNPINKEKMWYDVIGRREEPLLRIDQATAEQISQLLNIQFFTGEWYGTQVAWCLEFTLLKNLSIYIALTATENKIQVYYTKNVLNFEKRRIGFFTLLYCNAVIREARKILGDALPKLSEYL
jgi:hypothetical protein